MVDGDMPGRPFLPEKGERKKVALVRIGDRFFCFPFFIISIYLTVEASV